MAQRPIVLWGIGHTNAHIVRTWGQRPIPDCQLICLSNFAAATYSGMLPGVLAGDFSPTEMEIDLQRLCAQAGSRLVLDPVRGLDLQRQVVLFENLPPLPFDALSIGIGSHVQIPVGMDLGERMLSVKPMQTFLSRLREQIQLSVQTSGEMRRITIVGGGAAGVEIACCLPPFVSRTLTEYGQPNTKLETTLVHHHLKLHPGSSERFGAAVTKAVQQRGIHLILGERVVHVDPQRVRLTSGQEIESDLTIWATGPAAPPVLGQLGLPVSPTGFLLTDQSLKTPAESPIFCVGDSGSLVDSAVPKAGVFAVRQGPILWDNLQRLLAGQELLPFVPQRNFLKLLNLGDQTAIGEYYGFSFSGKWVWRLKKRIDSSFVKKYQLPGK